MGKIAFNKGENIILRIEMDSHIKFGEVATGITGAGGDIIAIDLVDAGKNISVRDLTINAADAGQIGKIEEAVSRIPGIKLIHVSDRTFLLHLGGKISTVPKSPVQNRDDLSRVYTPDVARVCMAIKEDPAKAFTLSIKKNTVAVVSDGSAVLGLGNIGPSAAMPVMEGKAVLFKQFAGVDAFPICISTQDTEEIIQTVKHIATVFGGINLEDISAPRCFEIEKRLREELDIPVFHDDQHGTAVVMYAGLLNALKLVNRSMEEIKVVVCGVGAAGVACTRMLLAAGVKEIVGVDRRGILTADQKYDNPMKEWFAMETNPKRLSGTLRDALRGADVFIGLSSGGLLTREDVMTMAANPIVFAMANPDPEILPEDIEDIAAVIATGRSDYPNQINNVLCFPGIFRAALDCRAVTINEEMKFAAAEAIASIITDEDRSKSHIIPSVFNHKVVSAVRNRVIEAAIRTGVAKKVPKDFR
ncbi:malate dehydrogenase (oxaloacetate-decarboxylating) [Paenibacillus sp. V4I3]|uniref:NAD-dependent malic enzyme n=1 Tax=unclassified Paenibacillus TaxID=185978 RepID=UPI002787A060|nr:MULTISPECIES: NAD-dependent malic enzyme [unclassified Paenibacillus]MDQ0878406.1 malate dehydrogenase (oxaloacetate-decarboxylating) [Paenibacillus sp. V4I3]MDQ0885740.1 malate dehydrogenase (oxaloacetate-decarboxylating) [Paenibacillus sp. V4I9]